ncbi:MAG: heavy-metal-associated domain-containing protein [Zoogloeaceae bacterium]|jgi:copper chaperone|nr:heavy-metal-associated domain-containing protein [Zoogloeaceae bacterium]
MATTTIQIDGISCDGCSSQISRLLKERSSVTKSDVELSSVLTQVEFDAAQIGREALLAVIRDAGFGTRIAEGSAA